MNYKDYYKTLGVSKDASTDDIQRAYKKLARKHHPDVNKGDGAEAKFKEINEAQQVLSDPEKRAKYDQFGSAWEQQRRQGGGEAQGFDDFFSQFSGGGGRGGGRGGARSVEFDFGSGGMGGSGFSSFFEALFGGAGPGQGQHQGQGQGFAGWGGAGGAPRPRQGSDHETRITLSLEEAARGGKKTLQMSDPQTGRSKTLEVNIPPGVTPGKRIRLSGQGGAGSSGGPAGHLYLAVDVTSHPTLRLEGTDLHTTLPITPWEAALGGEAKLSTLNGDVTIRIPAGTSSGRKIRLKGKGFPTRSGAGDLYARLRIMIPEKLSKEERELYEKLAQTSDFNPRD